MILIIHITKGCGEITVPPHPKALWITTVIHSIFLFLSFLLTFLFFFSKLLFFSTFLFFYLFIFFFFIHITKGCGEITVSPHPKALWITIVIHNAFLFFLLTFSFFLFFSFFFNFLIFSFFFHLFFFQNFFC